MSLLTGSANCIKYVLFAFNLVFMITGIILIVVGISVKSVYRNYDDFLTTRFFSIPTFLIVIGTLVIIISLFGFWGALKENYCLILIFTILLALIFILELTAGICGYVLRSDAEDLVRKELETTITQYGADDKIGITILWDDMQREFSCCGIEDYKSWANNTLVGNTSLPISCCKIPYGAIGVFKCTPFETDKNRYPGGGCLKKFSSYISDHAVTLGAFGIVIAIIQFFGVLFAGYVTREIKIRNGITGFI